jgi:hypothetical protein
MSESRDKISSDQISSFEEVAASASQGMSRRRLFQTLVGSAAALSAGLTLVQSEPADAQSKTPKKVAKYQDHPNKGEECSKCRFFIAPHSCQLVAGKISPHGWCSFFAKKSA